MSSSMTDTGFFDDDDDAGAFGSNSPVTETSTKEKKKKSKKKSKEKTPKTTKDGFSAIGTSDDFDSAPAMYSAKEDADDIELDEMEFDEEMGGGGRRGGFHHDSDESESQWLQPKTILISLFVLVVVIGLASWQLGWLDSNNNNSDPDFSADRDADVYREPTGTNSENDSANQGITGFNNTFTNTTNANTTDSTSPGDGTDDENESDDGNKPPVDPATGTEQANEKLDNAGTTSNTTQTPPPVNTTAIEKEREEAVKDLQEETKAEKDKEVSAGEKAPPVAEDTKKDGSLTPNATIADKELDKELNDTAALVAKEFEKSNTAVDDKTIEVKSEDVDPTKLIGIQIDNTSADQVEVVAEAEGVDPNQVLKELSSNGTVTNIDVGPTKNPIFENATVLLKELRDEKNPSSQRKPTPLFIESLGATPPGSAYIGRLLQGMRHHAELSDNHEASAEYITNYLDDLPYDQIWNDDDFIAIGDNRGGSRNNAFHPPRPPHRTNRLSNRAGREKMKLDPWVRVHNEHLPPSQRICQDSFKPFQAYLEMCNQSLVYRNESYLVYQCLHDSCNDHPVEHLTSVIYAFVLAMLTKRILIVDWPSSFAHLSYATFNIQDDYLRFMEMMEAASAEEKLAFQFLPAAYSPETGDRGEMYQEVPILQEGIPGVEPKPPVLARGAPYGDWATKKYVLYQPAKTVSMHLLSELLQSPDLARELIITHLNRQTGRDEIWSCLINFLIRPQQKLLKAMEPYLPFLLDPNSFTVGVQGMFHDGFTRQQAGRPTLPTGLLLDPHIRDQFKEHLDRVELQPLLAKPFQCAHQIFEGFHVGELSDVFGKRMRNADNSATNAHPKELKYFFISNSKLLRNAVVHEQEKKEPTLVLNITVLGEVGAKMDIPTDLGNKDESDILAWQHQQKEQLLASTWLEWWLFGLTDHQVIPTHHHGGSFGKLAALRTSIHLIGDDAPIDHIWDGSPKDADHISRHIGCKSQNDALKYVELESDMDLEKEEEKQEQPDTDEEEPTPPPPPTPAAAASTGATDPHE